MSLSISRERREPWYISCLVLVNFQHGKTLIYSCITSSSTQYHDLTTEQSFCSFTLITGLLYAMACWNVLHDKYRCRHCMAHYWPLIQGSVTKLLYSYTACDFLYQTFIHTVNQQILACYYIWRIACFRWYLSRQIYVSYVDRTLHRRGDAKFNSRQVTLFWETPNFIAAKICCFTVHGLVAQLPSWSSIIKNTRNFQHFLCLQFGWKKIDKIPGN